MDIKRFPEQHLTNYLLRELVTGSAPDFEAKTHAGQMTLVTCFCWAQKALFPWALCERDIYND